MYVLYTVYFSRCVNIPLRVRVQTIVNYLNSFMLLVLDTFGFSMCILQVNTVFMFTFSALKNSNVLDWSDWVS